VKLALFILFFVWSSLAVVGQSSSKILFIGNSYIYANNLPSILENLANAVNDTIVYSTSTPGGAQLVQHVSNNNTLQLIRQGDWDYVIIQEQSQKPSFSPGQVATDVLPYARQLNDSIVLHNPCAETVFFMTWGRQNGDQNNCAFYPPVCTYQGMQHRLRESYMLMADQNNAICAPVGAVWHYVRDSFPGINLYSSDGSHPSFAGSYLAACTFYSSIFRKSPVGLNYYGSLSVSDALHLQNAADKVVLDSLENWKIAAYDIQASFGHVVFGDSVQFTNTSAYAATYWWDFGDSTQSSTVQNPNHVYTNNGSYTVTLMVEDSCGQRDTFMQSIGISLISASPSIPLEEVLVFPKPAQEQLFIQASTPIVALSLYDLQGSMIVEQKIAPVLSTKLLLNTAAKGIYLLRVKLSNQCIVKKIVIN
jgi:hypothetical protein